MHQDNNKIQDGMEDSLDYLYRSDQETMYFDQAMKEPDRQEFLNASIREVNRHYGMKHRKLLLHKDSPKGKLILDSIRAMKRKRYIVTRQLYKWKARLNVHGGK